VISTQDDLDPRVGNADHNLDLFLYDLDRGEFTQISETVGGFTLGAANCPALGPSLNANGDVVLFDFFLIAAQGCRVDGPQRNEEDGFAFQNVRAIRKRPGNLGPVWNPPRRVRVRAGHTLELGFTATDPEDDFLTYFAQVRGTLDVIPGSEIIDHHDGTATLRWPTKVEDAGVFPIRVAVFDEGGGEEYADVEIAVCNRIANEATLPGVLAAVFAGEASSACDAADINADGAVNVADLVALVRGD